MFYNENKGKKMYQYIFKFLNCNMGKACLQKSEIK